MFGPNAPVGVQRQQTYYFRVRARDNAGNLTAYTAATSTGVEMHRLYLPGLRRSQ